jgi:hypothetical protein
MPATVFSLLIVSAYYGVKCLGGFSQTTYLTQAQTIYNKLFGNSITDPDEHTQTLGSDITIAFIEQEQKLIPATGLDLILYSDTFSTQNFLDTIKQMTLKQAFYATLPELYSILYPAELTDKIAQVSVNDIISLKSFRSVIKPLIKK